MFLTAGCRDSQHTQECTRQLTRHNARGMEVTSQIIHVTAGQRCTPRRRLGVRFTPFVTRRVKFSVRTTHVHSLFRAHFFFSQSIMNVNQQSYVCSSHPENANLPAAFASNKMDGCDAKAACHSETVNRIDACHREGKPFEQLH